MLMLHVWGDVLDVRKRSARGGRCHDRVPYRYRTTPPNSQRAHKIWIQTKVPEDTRSGRFFLRKVPVPVCGSTIYGRVPGTAIFYVCTCD